MSVNCYTFILFKTHPDALIGVVRSGRVRVAASQSPQRERADPLLCPILQSPENICGPEYFSNIGHIFFLNKKTNSLE